MASLDTKMILTLEIRTAFSWWDALKLRLAGPQAQQVVIARLRALGPHDAVEHESLYEARDDG